MDRKILLSEFMQELRKYHSLANRSSIWSLPTVYIDGTDGKTIEKQAAKFIADLKKKKIIRESIEDIVCILADWDTIAEGIIYTTKAIYVFSPKNKNKNFRVRYDDIAELTYYSFGELDITDYDDRLFEITTKLWNKHTIKLFLEFATANYDYTDEEMITLSEMEIPCLKGKNFRDFIAGTVYGNVSNAATIYGEEKFHASRGHGFAAERVNTLFDKLTGHKAEIVGDNNAKNGADRTVDGIAIQSKYCKTGGTCIAECFENGKFRYWNSDGTPMQIEVPADQYETAVQAMRIRISRGEVQGITDPNEAEQLVRQGKFTYEQVKNIAKAGTIESIAYDATNGAIIASTSFGITAIVSFATSVWNGEELEFAMKNAAANGLKVGGITFVTAVLAGQLTKAGFNSMLVGTTESMIRVLGPKGSAVLVNAFRSGSNIYGAAAMKSASKLLRGNIITGIASIVVLSVGDVSNIFRGRISGKQMFKNVTNTVASVAGGSAGWVGGAAAGAAIGSAVPIVGTVIGGTVGGILGALGGGAIANGVSSTLLDTFIEDDANRMVDITEKALIALVSEYLLTQREMEHIVDYLSEKLDATYVKDMYAASDKKEFAKAFIAPMIEREIGKRQKIKSISQDAMQCGLRLLLEDVANDKDYEMLTD